MEKSIVKTKKQYKLVKKIKEDLEFFFDRDNFLDFAWRTTLILVASGIIAGAAHHIGFSIVRDVKNPRNERTVEYKISTQENGISNFTYDVFSVSETEDGKKLINLYGDLLLTKDSKPVYGCVSYEIDNETYEYVRRYVSTSFVYNKYGQPIHGFMKPRKQKFGDKHRAYKAEYRILNKLREIVESEPASYQIFDDGASLDSENN